MLAKSSLAPNIRWPLLQTLHEPDSSITVLASANVLKHAKHCVRVADPRRQRALLINSSNVLGDEAFALLLALF